MQHVIQALITVNADSPEEAAAETHEFLAYAFEVGNEVGKFDSFDIPPTGAAADRSLHSIRLGTGAKVPSAIYTDAGEPVCVVDSMEERQDDAAVAARLAACWNACRGVPVTNLRPGALADARRMAAADLKRDDCLRKFSGVMRNAEDWPDTNKDREALEELVRRVRVLLGE